MKSGIVLERGIYYSAKHDEYFIVHKAYTGLAVDNETRDIKVLNLHTIEFGEVKIETYGKVLKNYVMDDNIGLVYLGPLKTKGRPKSEKKNESNSTKN